MWLEINGAKLYVEVLGEGAGKPVLIAHHGGGGIGSFHEPKATFGPLSDIFQVIVFDLCVQATGVTVTGSTIIDKTFIVGVTPSSSATATFSQFTASNSACNS